MLAHTAHLPIFPNHHSEPRRARVSDNTPILLFEAKSRRRGLTIVNLGDEYVFICVTKEKAPQWICEPQSAFYMPAPVYMGDIFVYSPGSEISATEFYCEE